MDLRVSAWQIIDLTVSHIAADGQHVWRTGKSECNAYPPQASCPWTMPDWISRYGSRWPGVFKANFIGSNAFNHAQKFADINPHIKLNPRIANDFFLAWRPPIEFIRDADLSKNSLRS
jgi:hypothetical protein